MAKHLLMRIVPAHDMSMKPDRQKTKRPSGKPASGVIMLGLDVNKTDEYRFRLKEIPFYDMAKGRDGKGRQKIMVK